MKIYFVLIGAIFLLHSASGAELKTEKPPMLSAEVEVTKYVRATECYVLFLLAGSGDTMQEAKGNFERKLADFSRTAKKDFPEAKLEVIAVNIGNRVFNSYRASESAFAPNITKILLFTLPPDEDMAVKLLDSGIKSGLVPFCGESAKGTFGAVFYGLKAPEPEIEKLYSTALQAL